MAMLKRPVRDVIFRYLLNNPERALLEEAATLAGVSASEFSRDATLRSARRKIRQYAEPPPSTPSTPTPEIELASPVVTFTRLRGDKDTWGLRSTHPLQHGQPIKARTRAGDIRRPIVGKLVHEGENRFGIRYWYYTLG